LKVNAQKGGGLNKGNKRYREHTWEVKTDIEWRSIFYEVS